MPVEPGQASGSSGNPPPFSQWGMPTAGGTATSSPEAVPSQMSVPAPFMGSIGNDPIAFLHDSQASFVQTTKATIPDLEMKSDLSWSQEPIGGARCTLDAYDAPGPANIAWLGSVFIPGKMSSLTIFNGPLTDVPHLLSRCLLDGNQLQLALDFRPRAYGAYEMVDSQGNYPGPEELGRKAFEYSGARSDFFNKFATQELQATLSHFIKSLEGATPTNIQPSNLDLLTGSPLAISLTMPVTDQNLRTVAELRQKAAESWLSWATDSSGTHDHRPGAPINTQYVYDAKFRQNAYLALRAYYSAAFGHADGSKLAAAESGPLDEAYVGGGS